ncbi:uracil-DNA glycosylase family protein [Phaeodactylibacter luteus]|uniref:Uracil-DNA glycosylase family protein n=1 Tax=Phaeodactylibacter luteus TaxID=1564516 RepID=A0A5C6RH31_9BACT|nr:uracil-DNA glycosylase family protein [Phaeodactylibacter luteus]TXB61621.1 uracil-DNA glycosylase family protein [Phaeodactylibacter luteus]
MPTPLPHLIGGCTHCARELALGPKPIFQLHPAAKILLISQAPGRIAHSKGVAFKDPSGARLRQWLGVTAAEFYTPEHFAILPMAFCYPGKASSGDLPPPAACAPKWHAQCLEFMPQAKLRLYIGQYAQRYYLGKERKRNLTETVRAFREYGPEAIPLPHPSPLNNRWLKQHPWFEQEAVPYLQEQVSQILGKGQ